MLPFGMAFDHLSPAHRTFVSYIDKSREFYQAHGYDKPYRWASNATAPFAKLQKPLSEARVGVVTTTFFHRDSDPQANDATDGSSSNSDAGSFQPKTAYAAASSPPPSRMFTDDLSWHKDATHTDDVESFLPLIRLQEYADAGTIGGLSPRFYGVPTEYSQRKTEADAARVVDWCQADAVDVVLLVPL